MILGKKSKDPSFQTRLFRYLIEERTSNKPDICKECSKRWSENEKIYRQTLGLVKPLFCSNYQCICEQQKKIIPKIQDPNFLNFIWKFDFKKRLFEFLPKTN